MCKINNQNPSASKSQVNKQLFTGSAYIASDERMYSEEDVSRIKYKNNTIWAMVLLVAIILILVAAFCVIYMFDDLKVQAKLLTIMSVVSTLLAIVLSGFSIFYSYFSTKESSSILFKVSNEVKQIEKTYSLLQSYQGDLIKFIANNQTEENTLPPAANDIANVQGANMTSKQRDANPPTLPQTLSGEETPKTDSKK